MRRSLTPAVVIAGLVVLAGCSSDNGESDDPGPDSTKPRDAAAADTTPDTDTTPNCDRLSKTQLRGLADGAKRGVKVVTGYGVELGQVVDGDIGFQAASYTAAAVRVKGSRGAADVLLAIPTDLAGAGLTLVADDAAPKYFNWGVDVGAGSPVAEVAEAVAASTGADDAMECLAQS